MSEHELYLTVGKHPREPGKLLAICSRGQPQFGDKNIDVLTLEVVDTMQQARDWFARVQVEQPWETRS